MAANWHGYLVESAGEPVGTVAGVTSAVDAIRSPVLAIRLGPSGRHIGYVALADVACIDSVRRVVTLQRLQLLRDEEDVA